MNGKLLLQLTEFPSIFYYQYQAPETSLQSHQSYSTCNLQTCFLSCFMITSTPVYDTPSTTNVGNTPKNFYTPKLHRAHNKPVDSCQWLHVLITCIEVLSSKKRRYV